MHHGTYFNDHDDLMEHAYQRRPGPKYVVHPILKTIQSLAIKPREAEPPVVVKPKPKPAPLPKPVFKPVAKPKPIIRPPVIVPEPIPEPCCVERKPEVPKVVKMKPKPKIVPKPVVKEEPLHPRVCILRIEEDVREYMPSSPDRYKEKKELVISPIRYRDRLEMPLGKSRSCFCRSHPVLPDVEDKFG